MAIFVCLIATSPRVQAQGYVNTQVTYTGGPVINHTAKGGNGGSAGGGGGAGLGGALFLDSGALVIINGVSYTGNSAVGGNGYRFSYAGGGGGGGAGIGGATGGNGGGQASLYGGGGGGGALGIGQTGGNGGFVNGGIGAGGTGANGGGNGGASANGGGFYYGGGGGGGGLGAGSPGNGHGGGGNGAFGGGGGGSGDPGQPAGNGGFGGGAAENNGGGTQGTPGFGGGTASGNKGGGGAGFGGAIFVNSGASLTIEGNSTFSGNSVAGGLGNQTGAAAGSDLFIMSGTTVTLSPGVGNTITFADAGSIADSGGAGASIVINGGGTVDFQQNNTYAGGTTVSGATTLQVENSTALGSGTVAVQSGASLNIAGGTTLANTITISGAGVAGGGAIYSAAGVAAVSGPVTLGADSTVADTGIQLRLTGLIGLGANTLTVAGSSQTQLTGAMSGTGSLVVNNGAVAFINGASANSYTGLTTVNSGGSLYLSKSAGTLATAGSLAISGTVVDNTSGQLSASAVVTLFGTGQFQFFQSGGAETIAGLSGTSASSQVVALGQGGNNTLTLGGSDFYGYAGTLTDTAGHPLALVKQGAGIQTLTGASTYTGGTTIYGGDLQLGDGNTSGASVGTGDVTVSSTGTFTLNLAQGETFANHIVDNNAVVLDDNPSSNYTVAGLIEGTGDVTKNGGNVVTLTHANTYSGGTLISGGALIVGDTNALGTGPVVNNATLTTASVNHGMTINVGGDFINGANGVLGLAIYGANDYDSVHLTDPAGVAHLNGELLIVLPAQFAPGAGETFNLVTSSNAVDGQFASVVTTLPSIRVQAIYTDNAMITLRVAQLPFTSLGPYSSNGFAVAENLDANASNGSLTPLIGTLNGLSGAPGGLGPYFDQLTPLKFGQFTGTTAANNASFATEARDNYLAGQRTGANGTFAGGNGSIDASALTLNDPSYDPTLAMVHSRLLAWNPGPLGAISDTANAMLGGVNMRDPKDMKATGAPAYTDPWNFYVAGNVVLAQGFSQNDVAHFDSNTESVTVGTDYRITPNLLVGLAAGYGHTDATLDTSGSSATVDSYSPGFYASYADHGWYANLSGDYLHNAYTQSRVISFLGQAANSAPEGNEGVANLDGGYDFHRGALTFGPLAGVQYTHLTVDGYSESGSIADLTVQDQSVDSLRSRLGGRVSFTYSHGGINFTPHFDASWQHEFLDQSRGITSQFTGGVGAFSVKTTNPSRDSALADIGLDAEINRTVTVFGDYEIQAGQQNYFGQSIQAGAKIGF